MTSLNDQIWFALLICALISFINNPIIGVTIYFKKNVRFDTYIFCIGLSYILAYPLCFYLKSLL